VTLCVQAIGALWLARPTGEAVEERCFKKDRKNNNGYATAAKVSSIEINNLKFRKNFRVIL
jgi:hypothetical protein